MGASRTKDRGLQTIRHCRSRCGSNFSELVTSHGFHSNLPSMVFFGIRLWTLWRDQPPLGAYTDTPVHWGSPHVVAFSRISTRLCWEWFLWVLVNWVKNRSDQFLFKSTCSFFTQSSSFPRMRATAASRSRDPTTLWGSHSLHPRPFFIVSDRSCSRVLLRQQRGKTAYPYKKRLSIYHLESMTSTWKRAGAIEKQIEGKWHIIILREAIVDHELFTNRFHVTRYGGCGVLLNKDTFLGFAGCAFIRQET